MKKLLKLLLLLSPIGLIVAGFLFRSDIYDQWRLSQYDPPARIEQIAQTTTMTADGQKRFFVAHPEIDQQTTFNQHCDIKEFSIILGCYDGRNIYLYDVKDKRLAGIVEVTAAHEMLHAAYDQLSGTQRKKVDDMTNEVYQKLTNARLIATVKNYEKQDSASVPNELHSILATEVRSLPKDLEQYYAQYFSNRAAVVALSEKYEAEFTSRETQVAALDQKLKATKSTIDDNQSRISSLGVELTKNHQELDRLKSANEVSLYNMGVTIFNNQVKSYNALITDTKKLIADYNKMVKERNNLATEVQGLVEAIDSTPTETFKR